MSHTRGYRKPQEREESEHEEKSTGQLCLGVLTAG
jgi:hypothetical protein